MRKKIVFALACLSLLSLALLVRPSIASANEDGCEKPKQWCVCSDIKKGGVCEKGTLKPGLYCHCEPPIIQHDNCGSAGQACTCANIKGSNGQCHQGPMKKGLYCHCG